MKIAVPTEGGRVSSHFGHCEQFAILEVDRPSRFVLRMDFVTPPPHEPGTLPGWLHGLGVNVVLAGGMGARAADLLARHGIETVLGVPTLPVSEVVEAYLDGRIASTASACDHPGCGGDHHR